MQGKPFLVIGSVPLNSEWRAATFCDLEFTEKSHTALIPGRQASDVDRNSVSTVMAFLAKVKLLPRDCQIYWISC